MFLQRRIFLLLLAIVLAGCATQSAEIMPAPPLVVALASPIAPTSIALKPTAVPPTHAPLLLTATPTTAPTTTPNNTPTPAPLRVGIQVGHWRTEELPDELARFRTSTGAFAAGTSELEVNLLVAERLAILLRDQGIVVDLLPATVPISYQADAFLTIHADGSTSANARGFKMATPWRTSKASGALMDALMSEYAAGTEFPQDSAITVNMRGYYAFNWRRHQHAIAKTTPAVIVEMGYLTNPTDRAWMQEQPDRIAQSIAAGVLRYLNERDPNDQAALVPQEYPIHRFVNVGVTVHTAPNPNSGIAFTANADQRFLPFREQNGWYEGVVRGEWRVIGWVRVADLVATNEPFPTPTSQ